MHLSGIDIIDLFFRFAAVGQILLLILLSVLNKPTGKTYVGCVLSFCFACFVLLTAPIDDHHYGFLRGCFLFFTEFIPYIFWLLAMFIFREDLIPEKLPLPVYITLAGIVVWFAYFFGYLQGRGAFHQINHTLEFIPLFHILYLALKDLTDDLVAARRNYRLLIVLLICTYLIFIVMLELASPWVKSLTYFSITNAIVIFAVTTLLGWLFKSGRFTEEGVINVTATEGNNSELMTGEELKPEPTSDIPLAFLSSYQQLLQLMDDGFYKQSQLTINQLAKKVDLPEHQLRELINKHIGFRNFSEYLNSYRIPAACEQFKDINYLRTPILTIALELGYGSIATFNRAFKQHIGMTPKEYRDQFQK